MLIRVAVHTIETELKNAATPVLLTCIHPNAATKPQIKMLEDVSQAFGQSLKICLLCEEIPALFGNIYGIEGTPTYLMVSRNKVVDRLLGQVEPKILIEFIEQTLSSIE